MTAAMSEPAEARMRSYLKRIATGPEMSKNLTLEEARDGMALVLSGAVHQAQAAVFLIALRMKRESDEENRGVLEALRAATDFATAAVHDLADVADPYDGFVRHLPASPFLPAVLAACGLPAVSHGCQQVGPKFGVTPRQVLAAAGARVDLSPSQAATQIADPRVGWAYVDQRTFCPPLRDLAELRRLIVKRPCSSTLEKLMGPVRAAGRTHLLIGYVHRGYERLLPLLARHAGYASGLVVRGVEGGTVPPLNAPAACVMFRREGSDEPCRLDPREAGVAANVRAVPLPAGATSATEEGDDAAVFPTDTAGLAAAAAAAGGAALVGAPGGGPTRDSLVLAAATILHCVGRFGSLGAAAGAARRALDSGAARAHFERG